MTDGLWFIAAFYALQGVPSSTRNSMQSNAFSKSTNLLFVPTSDVDPNWHDCIISNHLFKVQKKNISKSEISYLLRFRLKKYNFRRKKTTWWLNSVFPFILYMIWIRIRNPDLRAQMNADPTGSESTPLVATFLSYSCCHSLWADI